MLVAIALEVVAPNLVSQIASGLYPTWKKETKVMYPGVGAIACLWPETGFLRSGSP